MSETLTFRPQFEYVSNYENMCLLALIASQRVSFRGWGELVRRPGWVNAVFHHIKVPPDGMSKCWYLVFRTTSFRAQNLSVFGWWVLSCMDNLLSEQQFSSRLWKSNLLMWGPNSAPLVSHASMLARPTPLKVLSAVTLRIFRGFSYRTNSFWLLKIRVDFFFMHVFM